MTKIFFFGTKKENPPESGKECASERPGEPPKPHSHRIQKKKKKKKKALPGGGVGGGGSALVRGGSAAAAAGVCLPLFCPCFAPFPSCFSVRLVLQCGCGWGGGRGFSRPVFPLPRVVCCGCFSFCFFGSRLALVFRSLVPAAFLLGCGPSVRPFVLRLCRFCFRPGRFCSRVRPCPCRLSSFLRRSPGCGWWRVAFCFCSRRPSWLCPLCSFPRLLVRASFPGPARGPRPGPGPPALARRRLSPVLSFVAVLVPLFCGWWGFRVSRSVFALRPGRASARRVFCGAGLGFGLVAPVFSGCPCRPPRLCLFCSAGSSGCVVFSLVAFSFVAGGPGRPPLLGVLVVAFSFASFASFAFFGSRSLSPSVLSWLGGLAASLAAGAGASLVVPAPASAGSVSSAVLAAVPASASVSVVSAPPGLVGGPALAARASASVRLLAGLPAPLAVAWPSGPCPVSPAPAVRRSWSSCGSGSWSEVALALGWGVPVLLLGPAAAGGRSPFRPGSLFSPVALPPGRGRPAGWAGSPAAALAGAGWVSWSALPLPL